MSELIYVILITLFFMARCWIKIVDRKDNTMEMQSELIYVPLIYVP